MTLTVRKSSKPADYVYFERSTAGLSQDATTRATTAKMKLEHFYKVAVEAAIERNTRYASIFLVVRRSGIAFVF